MCWSVGDLVSIDAEAAPAPACDRPAHMHTHLHTHTLTRKVSSRAVLVTMRVTIPQLHLQRFGEGQAKALKILGNALVGLEEWQEAVNALKKAHQVGARDSRSCKHQSLRETRDAECRRVLGVTHSLTRWLDDSHRDGTDRFGLRLVHANRRLRSAAPTTNHRLRVHVLRVRWSIYNLLSAILLCHISCLCQHDQQDAEIRADLQKAEAALKQSKTKDYYKVQGALREPCLASVCTCWPLPRARDAGTRAARFHDKPTQ
jgi:hypothetical protein